MINLLPPKVKIERKFGRLNRRLLAYGVSIMVIGVLSITVVLFNMKYVQADEQHLSEEMKSRESEAAKLEASQKEVDTVSGQLKTIDKLYSGEVRFSELIPKIGALLPNGMVLNGLSLSGGKTNPLQLDVDMDTQDLAAVFLQNLVHSDLFEAVDISSIVSKGTGVAKPGVKNYGYGATLSASFKGTAAAKKAATAVPAPVPAGTAK